MPERHKDSEGASGNPSASSQGYKRKASEISTASPPAVDFANALTSTNIAPQSILENLSSPSFASDIASLGTSMPSSAASTQANTEPPRAIMSSLQNQRFQRNVPAFLNKLYK
jgi:hypothetical protein